MKNTVIRYCCTFALSLLLSVNAVAQPYGQPVAQPGSATGHYTWDGYSLNKSYASPERATGVEAWGYVLTNARTGKKHFESAPGVKSASGAARYLQERQERERRVNAFLGTNRREYAQAVAPVAKLKISPIVWTFVPKDVTVGMVVLSGPCSCQK